MPGYRFYKQWKWVKLWILIGHESYSTNIQRSGYWLDNIWKNPKKFTLSNQNWIKIQVLNIAWIWLILNQYPGIGFSLDNSQYPIIIQSISRPWIVWLVHSVKASLLRIPFCFWKPHNVATDRLRHFSNWRLHWNIHIQAAPDHLDSFNGSVAPGRSKSDILTVITEFRTLLFSDVLEALFIPERTNRWHITRC